MQRAGNSEALQLPANLSNFGGTVGQPLPDPVLQKMESFFGTSFADVRVHVGSQASSIGALAFTHGSDLYFAPGQYNPNTIHGQQLLGHELTHVVQQRAGHVQNPFGSGIAVVQDRALETEADRAGQRAAAHRVPAASAKGAVQRSAAARPGAPASLQLRQETWPCARRGNQVVQMERYVDNVADPVHLHLDIGHGDHLMINASRYNLMGGHGYDQGRVEAALTALRAHAGGAFVGGTIWNELLGMLRGIGHPRISDARWAARGIAAV